MLNQCTIILRVGLDQSLNKLTKQTNAALYLSFQEPKNRCKQRRLRRETTIVEIIHFQANPITWITWSYFEKNSFWQKFE